MADSSVAITAGSGTPIRVLTALGTAVFDASSTPAVQVPASGYYAAATAGTLQVVRL